MTSGFEFSYPPEPSQEGLALREQRWRERLDDLAVVRQAARVSPLIEVWAPVEDDNTVLLKLESTQDIKSFKIRGATYAIASDRDTLRRRSIVADSGGNHAQAVALAGRELGIPVRIIMAEVVPESKKAATLRFGASDGSFELDTTPPSFVEAKVKAKQIAGFDENGQPPADEDAYPKYLSPYDDPSIVRGTATLVPEIIQQLEELGLRIPNTCHVPVGGGGLISGIADVNAEQDRMFGLYGHSLVGADSAARSLHSPEPVAIENPNVIAEGLAVKIIGNEVHRRIKDGKIDDIYTAELAEVGKAFQWYIEHVLPQLDVDTRDEEALWNNLPELSSMVAVAGMFRHIRHTQVYGQTHLVVISGGNTDRVKVQTAMDAAQSS